MFKLKTDIVNIEFDDRIDATTTKLVMDIIDKLYTEAGVSMNALKKQEPVNTVLLKANKKVSDEIIKEEPITVNMREATKSMREAGLPKTFSSLNCGCCHQSFMMVSKKTGDLLFKNHTNGKIYNFKNEIQLPEIKYPFLITHDTLEKYYASLVDICKDCLQLCEGKEEVVLLSDSDDMLECPFCKVLSSIKDMYGRINKEEVDEKCFVCQGDIEQTIVNKNGTGVSISKCTNFDCIEKIKD